MSNKHAVNVASFPGIPRSFCSLGCIDERGRAAQRKTGKAWHYQSRDGCQVDVGGCGPTANKLKNWPTKLCRLPESRLAAEHSNCTG